MDNHDIPCTVRGCLFVARWALFDEREPEETVCLCPAHMEELRKANPTRAAKFIRIAKGRRPVISAGPRAA